MKKLYIFLTLALFSTDGFSQYESNQMKYDTTQLETNFDIAAWGTEPAWSFNFHGTSATGNLANGEDSILTYTLVDRINNQGFTNEFVDTYVFASSSGEMITLILVKNDECACGYDMGEGESNVSALLQTNVDGKSWMLLGCARINDRP